MAALDFDVVTDSILVAPVAGIPEARDSQVRLGDGEYRESSCPPDRGPFFEHGIQRRRSELPAASHGGSGEGDQDAWAGRFFKRCFGGAEPGRLLCGIFAGSLRRETISRQPQTGPDAG